MKTILCIYPFQFEAAGFRSRLFPLGRALNRLGYNVVFISVGYGRKPAITTLTSRIESKSIHQSTKKRTVRIPVELHESLSGLFYFVIGRYFPPIFHLNDLIVAMNEKCIEVEGVCAVICQKPFFRTVRLSVLASRLFNVPCILDLDDYDISNHARFLSLFDLITVASKTLYDLFSEWEPLLISNAPSDELLSLVDRRNLPTANEEVNTIFMYPGTGIPKENLLAILKALDPSQTLGRLTLVGFPLGFSTDSLLSISSNRIELHNTLPHSDVLKLLRRSQLSICVDRDTTYGNAKSSIRLLESLASGCAIIAWDCGETGRIVKESGAGIAVPFGDAVRLREAYLKLLSDSSYRNACSDNALKCVRSFDSWETNARKLKNRILHPYS